MLFGQALEAMNTGKTVRIAGLKWTLQLVRDGQGKPSNLRVTNDGSPPAEWKPETRFLLSGDWEVA